MIRTSVPREVFNSILKTTFTSSTIHCRYLACTAVFISL
jgi:hypothetical protein